MASGASIWFHYLIWLPICGSQLPITMDILEIRVGEKHTITLKGLGAAGFRWSATVADGRMVQVESIQSVPPPPIQPAAYSRDEQFVLTGLAPGETMVHLVQARSFERSKPPHATYDIMVRVKEE